MSVVDRLKQKIEAELSPDSLEIINESHLHAGHQESFDGTGETHLRIRIVAPAFEGMTRIDRHRAINALAAPEMEHGLHALAVEARSPSEAS